MVCGVRSGWEDAMFSFAVPAVLGFSERFEGTRFRACGAI